VRILWTVSNTQCTIAAIEQSHKASEIYLQASEKTVVESLTGLVGPLHKVADFLIKSLQGYKRVKLVNYI